MRTMDDQRAPRDAMPIFIQSLNACGSDPDGNRGHLAGQGRLGMQIADSDG